MTTKLINCKMKEIYFSPIELKENPEESKARFKFWYSMDLVGLQNMSLINLQRV